MNFFRPSVFGYPARPPLSLPPSLYPPLEVGPLAIPGAKCGYVFYPAHSKILSHAQFKFPKIGLFFT